MDIVTDTTTQRSDSVTNISVPHYSGVRFSASSSLPHAPVLPDPHIDEKAYCKEIAAVQSSLSFPLSKGKYNPYSGKPIQTLQDYEFYCQCVALRRIYDKKIASAAAVVRSTQDILSAADVVVMDSRRSAAMARQEAAIAKREAALYKHDAAVAKSEYAELKTRFDARKKVTRLWFVVLVSLLVGFFCFTLFLAPQKAIRSPLLLLHPILPRMNPLVLALIVHPVMYPVNMSGIKRVINFIVHRAPIFLMMITVEFSNPEMLPLTPDMSHASIVTHNVLPERCPVPALIL